MNKCERLHKILEKGKLFDANYNKKDIPDFGIYVFFEKEEKAFGGNRIVRIGITKGYYSPDETKRCYLPSKIKGKTLHTRLKTHYFGPKRQSVFRRKIGEVYLRDDDEMRRVWNDKKTTIGDPKIESKVSDYMAKNMTFKIIRMDNIDRRKELEKRLIGTVSNCNECIPSKDWFGHKSPNPKVRGSGLWQEEHLLYKTELTENDFNEIEFYLVMAGDK